jgi:HEPN domain-containing protein
MNTNNLFIPTEEYSEGDAKKAIKDTRLVVSTTRKLINIDEV